MPKWLTSAEYKSSIHLNFYLPLPRSISLHHKHVLLPFSVRDRITLAYTLRLIVSSSALILTLVNIIFLWLWTVSHGFKRIRLDLSHNPSSFDSTLHKLLLPQTMYVSCDVTMWRRHSFYGSNRKKRCSKWRTFNLKMTTGFGLFLSLSKVKIYFFLLFTSNLSCFNSFKLPYKIRLLGFRSPLNIKIIHFLKVFPILLSPIVAGECH